MVRALLTCLLLAWCAVRAAEVSAELSTGTVEVGQGAILSLRVEGGSLDEMPAVPPVRDLIVNPRGQSQQVQIVNGRVSRAIRYDFAVGSHAPGEYEIPSITVKVGGEEFRTQPLKLAVRPSAAGAPQGMDEEGNGPADSTEYGYLTFQMVKKERKHVYPGEIAPVRIQAYFPMGARVSLSGPPRPEGSAFTLHNLTQEPQQSVEVVDGQRYRVVTWYGGLSATKAGTYPASLALEGTVAVRDRSARSRPSPFDDPFFGGPMMDDFFAPMIQKDVELRTAEPPQIEVVELPAEGRPEDFSGAIGNFEFESVELPRSMRTGEPVAVDAQVKGTGNFALLKQPQPLPPEEWKTYEGRDDFTPGDAAAFGGSKRFEYNIVPRVPGTKDLQLGFSYFDPDEGEYRRVESVPQEVEITGQPLAGTGDDQAEGGKTDEPKAQDEPQLAPIRRDLGSVGSYRPLTQEAWFTPTLAGFGAVSVALLAWGFWIARHDDPSRSAARAAKQAVERALASADEAVARGDAAAFFAAARNVLRLRVAENGGLRPEAVTLADFEGRVDDEVKELWRAADRHDYSGEADADPGLERWQDALRRGLEALSEEHRAA